MSEQAALALVCGGGTIPAVVAAAAQRSGRRVVLFPLRGWADPKIVEGFPHHWIAVSQLGRLMQLARAEGCRDMVVIGALLRPPWRELRVDWATLRLLPRIARLFQGGDDRLLTGIAQIFEENGFRLMGAHEVAPEIVIPTGCHTRRQPTERDQQDIARGVDVLNALGPLDVGQAVVVADGYVAAVEAAEGTDAMIARIGELRKIERFTVPAGLGVVIKMAKPRQDLRFDLPTIGPRTIEGLAEVGLAGLAVAAGQTIMAEPDRLIALADRLSVFVVGLPVEQVHPAEQQNAGP